MAIDYPAGATDGQTYTYGGKTWVYIAATGAWVIRYASMGYANIDGGASNSIYGGISPITGGNASGV